MQYKGSNQGVNLHLVGFKMIKMCESCRVLSDVVPLAFVPKFHQWSMCNNRSAAVSCNWGRCRKEATWDQNFVQLEKLTTCRELAVRICRSVYQTQQESKYTWALFCWKLFDGWIHLARLICSNILQTISPPAQWHIWSCQTLPFCTAILCCGL